MIRLIVLLASVVVATMAGKSLPAQEQPKPAQPPSAEQQFAKAAAGPEHELFARYTGQWSIEIQMGAGANATFQGTAENRLTVGGRFLQLQYVAKRDNAATVKGNTGAIDGLFTLGFDRRHRRYTLISMDSFGTYFVTAEGARDDESGKLKLLGKDDDPMLKAMGFTKEFAFVLDFRSADEFAIEVWFIDTRTPERRERKFMAYTFKRQK